MVSHGQSSVITLWMAFGCLCYRPYLQRVGSYGCSLPPLQPPSPAVSVAKLCGFAPRCANGAFKTSNRHSPVQTHRPMSPHDGVCHGKNTVNLYKQLFLLIKWRLGSESNRRRRICNPLHHHSATEPSGVGRTSLPAPPLPAGAEYTRPVCRQQRPAY